ncbi:VanZ family protein [Paraclostridium bifermentans]|uniref:VanZ family protein n=1 Tax=Paraclostridium bifermentans TaxID=1490 RepID=UPI00359C2A22
MKKKYLVLTILWMIFIFYMSHQPATASDAQSGGFMEMLSNLPIIGGVLADFMKLDIAVFVVRKSAHMFLYFILSILIYLAIHNKYNVKAYIISFILTALYACTDEVHQLFIQGRSGEIRDVLIDSSGALIGLILVYIINKIIIKKKTTIYNSK